MLEEGLMKTTFPPGDAALAMLSFVRFELPEGGASAEERFLRLFSLLNDRIFGPISSREEQFRHEIGGWFSFQNRWDRPSSSRSKNSGAHTSHGGKKLSIELDPVVQLLCGIEALVAKDKLPTMIEAISLEAEHRPGVHFQFPFEALPQPTQNMVLAMIQSSIDGKPVDSRSRTNCERLFQEVLRVPPKEQHELRRYQASKIQQKQDCNRPLTMSPVSRVVSPFQNITNSSPGKKQDELKIPQIMLTMLEVYFVTFIRYALAAPKPASPQPQGIASKSTTHRSMPYGEQVYVHLFKCYLLHFFPHTEVRKDFIGFTPLHRDSEMFLRTVLEFWFACDMSFTSITKSLALLQDRRGMDTSLDLSTIFDLMIVNYDPPLPIVQTSIRSLVIHLLKNPDITLGVNDCMEVAERFSAGENSGAPPVLPWCLNPSLTVLQQTFYNYITATFRHAPIHVAASPFFTALDTWLIWLEPWNVEFRRKNSINTSENSAVKARKMLANTVANISHGQQKIDHIPVLILPKSKSSSRFTRKWEPYIAANLHFYTAPLAIFLRRASELDFSSTDFARSFCLVQRVFRVYSPEVVNAINSLLAGGGSHALSSLVATHNHHLADFSPAHLGQLSLSSLCKDTRNLLEEIYSQYTKKVSERDIFDRMEVRIERLLACVGLLPTISGEERDIQILVEKARMIVNLPHDYNVVPDPTKHLLGRVRVGESSQLERDKDGMLTERGRTRLMAGEVTCTPIDAMLFGDRMRSKPKSHEIAMLVPWTIYASDWINVKLGLDDQHKKRAVAKSTENPSDSVLEALLEEGRTSRKYWIRVNLRFLADYRNVFLIWVATWGLRKYLDWH